MTSRRLRHALALAAVLLTTTPLLALLCKGHTPSRFATANLPAWERQTPRPAPCRAPVRLPLAAPGQVQIAAPLLNKILLGVDERQLFLAVEHPKPTTNMRDAAKPGVWLQTACALGRANPRLRSEQDRVALRLMSAQDDDGCLGVSPITRAWTAEEESAQGRNIDGLLAYYYITHSPATIYAAVLAGDLLLSKCAAQANGLPHDLALPLTHLYQETEDATFLTGALRLSEQGAIDGPGLCALYAATGQPEYLRDAQARWKTGEQTPALAAALRQWTGAPGYAAFLARSAASPTWDTLPALAACAYSQTAKGTSVNLPFDSQATFGSLHLAQQRDPKTGLVRLAVQTTRPAALHLFVNGVAQPARPAPSATLTRRWKPGDVVVVKPGA